MRLSRRPKHRPRSVIDPVTFIERGCQLTFTYSPVHVDEVSRSTWDKPLEEFFAFTGLADSAPTVAWTTTASNQRLGYSTHGLFRYFGKFPPPIATRLIEEYTNPGDLILDPMCGSGTTGVEALWLDRPAVLNDVNPLAQLIASVKTTHLDEADMYAAVDLVTRAYAGMKPDDFLPSQIRNPSHWFETQTIDSLRRLRLAVEETSGLPGYNFVRLAFAACIRRVSKATTQQGRLFLDVATALDDAFPVFLKTVDRGIPRVSNLPMGFVSSNVGDVRRMSTGEQGSRARLAIVHPPYFNSYSYSAVNTLEMGWLDLNRKEVRKSEIREFFKVAKTHNVDSYVSDLSDALSSVGKSVESGGHLALMMGDARLRGEHIQVIKPLLATLPRKFTLKKIVLRVPRFTEASWAASQRRRSGSLGVQMFDFVLIFKVVE